MVELHDDLITSYKFLTTFVKHIDVNGNLRLAAYYRNHLLKKFNEAHKLHNPGNAMVRAEEQRNICNFEYFLDLVRDACMAMLLWRKDKHCKSVDFGNDVQLMLQVAAKKQDFQLIRQATETKYKHLSRNSCALVSEGWLYARFYATVPGNRNCSPFCFLLIFSLAGATNTAGNDANATGPPATIYHVVRMNSTALQYIVVATFLLTWAVAYAVAH
jgi:hypothetical protein